MRLGYLIKGQNKEKKTKQDKKTKNPGGRATEASKEESDQKSKTRIHAMLYLNKNGQKYRRKWKKADDTWHAGQWVLDLNVQKEPGEAS